MSIGGVPEVGLDDFVRRFLMRAEKLMWFLGAGASAAAGIPTATDMVWEFKQLLLVTQRGVPRSAVADLSNPAITDRLQAYIDASERFPKLGADLEYADLFEAAFPSEGDRRAYLDGKMKGAQPSYGHMALATLMRARLARLVWMTNFDPLVADACAKIYGATGPLSSIALEGADQAAPLINSERWPIEIKLHGDFRSARLKNTSDELRQQDARLRKALVDACQRFGLIVVGYSGRDASIMESLEEAAKDAAAFPHGLFWLHRGENAPPERVQRLLARAKQQDVEAALVRIDNFDEVLRDIVRVLVDVDTRELDAFASERQRWSAAPRPAGRRGFPVVRLNALPLEVPTICRRVVCEIGGHREVVAAVEASGVDVLVGRVKAGVIAFGSDLSVRSAFDRFGVTAFDLHTIEPKRLRYDSGERGLLRHALTRALSRRLNLRSVRRRATDLLAPSSLDDPQWQPLRQMVGELEGVVRGHPQLLWREGIATRLDWADGRLWLLVDPRIVFEGVTPENKVVAADFARERVVFRYNRETNDLLEFWARLLGGMKNEEIRALGIVDGVDAAFRLSPETAFSRRAYA